MGKRFKALLLFGPPGSGKGTQGKLLAEGGGHFHLSSGDIFRGLSPDSPGGKLFHKYASHGLLVPDDATIEIWRHHMDEVIAGDRFHPDTEYLLLDGIPRTRAQAEIIEQYINVEGIILFDAPDMNVLVERLLGRATKEGRLDDQKESVLRKRMEVFEKETVSVLSYYPDSIVTKINAIQPPLIVLRDVLNALADKLSC